VEGTVSPGRGAGTKVTGRVGTAAGAAGFAMQPDRSRSMDRSRRGKIRLDMVLFLLLACKIIIG
jgi:hypothetical protein